VGYNPGTTLKKPAKNSKSVRCQHFKQIKHTKENLPVNKNVNGRIINSSRIISEIIPKIASKYAIRTIGSNKIKRIKIENLVHNKSCFEYKSALNSLGIKDPEIVHKKEAGQ